MAAKGRGAERQESLPPLCPSATLPSPAALSQLGLLRAAR